MGVPGRMSVLYIAGSLVLCLDITVGPCNVPRDLDLHGGEDSCSDFLDYEPRGT